MKIKSAAFKNYERIPMECTCDGDGNSPQLEFLDVPENAKSLVLIVDDPNAPGGTFIHWLIWNIAPNTTEIKKIACQRARLWAKIVPTPTIMLALVRRTASMCICLNYTR